VLVAENGEVFVDRSYGIPPQAKYMPTTTVPQFSVGALSGIFTSICSQLPAQPAGRGNVQQAELYRMELGLEVPTTFGRDASNPDRGSVDYTKGWETDTFHGAQRLSMFGKPNGMRSAFVRFPDGNAAIIILTNDDSADVKGMAEKIADRLLSPK
jgi:hypothetical protein